RATEPHVWAEAAIAAVCGFTVLSIIGAAHLEYEAPKVFFRAPVELWTAVLEAACIGFLVRAIGSNPNSRRPLRLLSAGVCSLVLGRGVILGVAASSLSHRPILIQAAEIAAWASVLLFAGFAASGAVVRRIAEYRPGRSMGGRPTSPGRLTAS